MMGERPGAVPDVRRDATRVERLAILTTSDLIGGHEIQLVRLARTMSIDHPVVLIVTSTTVEQFFTDHGLEVRFAPFSAPGKIWHQWRAARPLAEVIQPLVDDCDAFLVSGGTIEACIAPARAIKIVRPDAFVTAYIPMYVDRAILFGPVGTIYNCASRGFIGPIDRFITINRIQARLIACHYRRPTRVIANLITPLTPPPIDLGPRLIFVGRLDDQQKNVSGAITWLDHPDNPYRTLHIFGDGPDRATIEAHAGRTDHISVTFHGWTPHDRLAGLLGRRDLLVMNSRWEGEPMIVRELAAAGIPAVGTDIPGFRGLLPRRSRFNDQRGLLALLNGHYAKARD